MVKTNVNCKCGHEIHQHRTDLKECYVHKKIKGSIYQCTCRDFEEGVEVAKGERK